MNDEQVRRYGRQILLDAVGGRGQRALLAAAVEAPLPAEEEEAQATYVALLYLAGAGLGTLIVAEDGALVREADIGILFDTQDVGAPRLAVLIQKIAALNPDVRVTPAGRGHPLQLGAAPPELAGAARALWRGSAAATAAIAALLSGDRTGRS